tara:strand:- start:212 stop:370 length:159 start_codon:yes stop_codon:yes gene_type:complete
MTNKLAKKHSEAKMSRQERKWVKNGNKAARDAARAFNRASRRASKNELRLAA